MAADKIICPHCDNEIEMIAHEHAEDEFQCPDCEGNFELDDSGNVVKTMSDSMAGILFIGIIGFLAIGGYFLYVSLFASPDLDSTNGKENIVSVKSLKKSVVGTYNSNRNTDTFKLTMTLKDNGDGYAISEEHGYEEVESFTYTVRKKRYRIKDGNYFIIDISNMTSYVTGLANIINQMWVVNVLPSGDIELRLMKKNESFDGNVYFIRE